MKTYNNLVSDLIKKDYAQSEEEYNLYLYENIALDLEKEYTLNEDLDLSYEEFINEILSTFDLIEVGLSNPDTVFRLTQGLIAFAFRYLKSEFYFDKKPYWLWDRLYNLYKRKNKDYNNSAEKGLKLDGIYSFKNKLQDKISRLYSYSLNSDMSVNEEKLDDTLKDLINYSMIFTIWYKKCMPKFE